MLNNGAFRFSYNKQLPANILNQNRISDRSLQLLSQIMIITLTLRRTATIETLSRTIFQFRLLRGDAAHTRHRCVRLTALSELADRFRSICGQEWTRPTQTGITTRLIRCAANGRYRDLRRSRYLALSKKRRTNFQ